MIRLSAAKAELAIVENEVVTSGAQRFFACAFALSEDWDGLNRTAVFRAGTRSVSVLLGGDNTAEIPWEVLQTPGITLHIGLYGAGADGLVLPTVWAEIGMIRPGAYPGGDALPPTPGAYDQLVEIAENAEKIAQSVRDDADKGAFDGEPGPAGPQGPQGEPGRDVQIDDAAVSSTETWSSRKIIDTLCPAFSAEGNPVVCTPVEGYPLGVTVSLDPVQAGEGEPSPENIRPISGRDSVQVTKGGKNLCPYGTVSFTGYHWKSFGHFLPPGTYTFSALVTSDDENYTQNLIYFFDTDENKGIATAMTPRDVRARATVNVPEKFDAIYLYASIGASQSAGKTATFADIQLELGSAATAYEPYQGDTYDISLPETVYGGTVDAATGEGLKTWEYIAGYNGETLPGEWISDRDVYAAGAAPTIGAQVAYKLAASKPFQATGNQSIPALSGENTLLTDGDSLAVAGRRAASNPSLKPSLLWSGSCSSGRITIKGAGEYALLAIKGGTSPSEAGMWTVVPVLTTTYTFQHSSSESQVTASISCDGSSAALTVTDNPKGGVISAVYGVGKG